MPHRNENLHKAKREKNDEFYTRYEDIEKEMVHYTEHLKGKVIYCPCDDWRWSNFVKYFKDNFKTFELKMLIATNYDIGDGAWKYTYDGEKETAERLEGSGDFRSAECIEFLKEADVVVTNPPFSLFREYVKQLMDYGKKFIIVGPMNAITNKEVFRAIRDNQLWLGYNKLTDFIGYDGKIGKVACRWFSNLDNENRNKPLDLYKRYSNEYIHYENFDGIDVEKVSDIPMDYFGAMGVPVSFLDSYCPAQFRILGNMDDYKEMKEIGINPVGEKGIALKNANGNKSHITKNTYAIWFIKNGQFKRAFKRIIIQRVSE